jgi:ABC-type polysaccharide/polyol phosphate export permease
MNKMNLAVADIKAGWARLDLVWELAWDDIRQRYRRTALGPFWVVIGIGLWVSMTGFIGMSLFQTDLKSYFSNVAVGMVLWIFLSNMLNEGTTLLQHNGNLILNTNIPISLYLVRLYLRNVLLFLHYLTIPLIVMLILGVTPNIDMLFVLPAFVLYSISGLCIATIFSFICARYRDLQQAVVALMQVVPLVTPILWKREFLSPDKRWIADVNPLYHYVNLIRAPIAGTPIDPLSFQVVGITTVVLVALAWLSFVLFNKKAAYWI